MQVAIKEKDLAAAEAHVQELQAVYNTAKINLEYGELRAPISGWVLQKNIEAGEVVNVGTPVVTLGDIEDLWMNVYVGEAAVGKLRLEDPVEVTVDAHPNQVFSGRIIFISQEAEFTPKNVQTEKERVRLVYRIKVDVPNPSQELKPGMPADAELVLDGEGR
jgi:HlyD family secretion protein